MSQIAADSLPHGYRETYRSQVPAWECDAVEHLTVAYYFDKIERGVARFLTEAGLDPAAMPAVAHQDFFVRYDRELPESTVYAIQTGVIEHDGHSLHLGHKLIDSDDGAVCTTIEHRLAAPPFGEITIPARIAWDGPARDARKVPEGEAGWLRTGTDIVTVSDLDWSGRLGQSACIHRFSSSGGHLRSRFGWTSQYEADNRIGYSTFEIQLELTDPPPVGTLIDIQARVAHIGRSSMHIAHRIVDAADGRVVAVLYQLGVHLDKDARRPSPITQPIKEVMVASMSEA